MLRRIDNIGFGDFKLIQDAEEFCYGTDAVLLARFAELEEGLEIAELCTGNGAVAFMLTQLYKPEHIVGIDINEHEISLARESASLNGLEELTEFFVLDVLDAKDKLGFECFDAVTINPPYQEKGCGISGSSNAKHKARFETTAGLADFFELASHILKPKGSLSMIHRPSRLVDILSLAREKRLEAKRLRMIAPHRGEAANIVFVQFVKGGGRELRIEPEYYVHEVHEQPAL